MTTKTLSGLKYLWKEAFEDTDEAIDLFFRTGFSEDRCAFTCEEGQVVCALYWFDCLWKGKKLAYIYALATRKSHRGKGLAGALLTDTHRLLKQKGYHGVILKPAEGLFPFYQRLGYALSAYISRFSAESGSTPAELKELSADDYAARRRHFLPEDSVLQEGAALEFLHTYARFYEGPDCLVASGRNTPVIFEYLGDTAAASGVLRCLGIPHGGMLTPGRDVPFAMYHPLVFEGEQGPGYLGISLE